LYVGQPSPNAMRYPYLDWTTMLALNNIYVRISLVLQLSPTLTEPRYESLLVIWQGIMQLAPDIFFGSGIERACLNVFEGITLLELSAPTTIGSQVNRAISIGSFLGRIARICQAGPPY
jgi:hypothetical protein